MNSRTATRRRATSETDITLTLTLDGTGQATLDTGVGFLDHMLNAFARHGRFDLQVLASGDLHVDDHHTVEDVGWVLGEALSEALGDRAGIARFGSSLLPMDEALAQVAIDLSGRSLCAFDAALGGKIGGFDAELIREFFLAFSRTGGLTLHARILAGENRHHMAEALFKGLGRALDEATCLDSRIDGIASTKGSLT